MGSSSLRILVTGLIAQYPLGGVTWDYIQYVLGLDNLGHEVYYLEDTGDWPYNPQEGGLASGKDPCAYNVEYLGEVMARFGLEDRWAYRFCDENWLDVDEWYGMRAAKRRRILETADLLVNVSGSLGRPEEYRSVGTRAYIDTDPVFTQIGLLQDGSSVGEFRQTMAEHDVLFSFGECLPGTLPPTSYEWTPTRQPIVLEEWTPRADRRETYTTVMNWTSYEGATFNGETYGQKNKEMLRFLDLPGRVQPVSLELAVNEGKTEHPPRDRLRDHGWRVVDPGEVCPDWESYRSYIRRSKGEWSVAKNGYVKGQPGWFSCRSACYMAAGRPVIVQDTGFGSVIPTGMGLISFETVEEAARAIRTVESDYERHAEAAREIARAYFRADQVLEDLIERALAGSARSSSEQ